uniref:Large ribosomal subunit protein bL17c n=1 Tax=Ditylum brightwellii TaxID=49249 RepID=A0A7S1ZRF2_9STRA|mmetsp:Transcript_37371/g.55943  ORF Transcript_37371/g.55943 Transcript_37371/m.55943 type:complete len:166 (+) Transcript_37371:136-633(+)
MRKRIKFRQLSRTPTHKWAMLRNMVTSLIKHERIQTTLPKAKELKYLADQVVGWGKDGSLHARRQADAVLREKPVLTKLIEVLGPRYADRDGGYTRILKLSQNRVGDNAKMAVIEYVDRPGEIRAARVPKKRMEKLLMMGDDDGEKKNLKDVIESLGIDPHVYKP